MMVLEEFLALILAFFFIGFISVSSSFSSMMSSKYFCSSPINSKAASVWLEMLDIQQTLLVLFRSSVPHPPCYARHGFRVD